MPSFSSFVRRGGKVAAPRRAPRRKIPAKEKAGLESRVDQRNQRLDQPVSEEVEHSAQDDSHCENGQASDHLSIRQSSRDRDQDLPASSSQTASISQILTNQTDPQHRSNSAIASQTAQESDEGHSDQISNGPVQRSRPTRNQRAKRNTDLSVSRPSAEHATTTATANGRENDIACQEHSAPSPAPSTHADVFQQITSRLQNGLEIFRASQTPSRAGSVVPVPSSRATVEREVNGGITSNERPQKRRKRNNDQSKTVQEQVAEVVAHATGNDDLTPRNNHRRGTPEDAEEHEIEVETIKLAELCDEHKWGRKSNREKEMAANWPEILRRRKQENEERMQKAEERRNRKRREQPLEGDTAELAIPEQAIVNGEIVAAGRIIDNRAHIVLEANDESRPVLEARDIFNRVTQDTIAPKRRIAPGQVWDEESTTLFYQGLSMFGTDFNMIANMIPSKNRRQVKLKYNMEERNSWPKVKAALNKNEDVSLDQYATMTGMTFGSVEDLYKELEEEEKRIRADDEARRKEEGIISQPVDGEVVASADVAVEGADIAVPSIEVQDGEQQQQSTAAITATTAAVIEVQSDRARSTATTRLGSVTTGGRQTAQPPGMNKKKIVRKTNPNSKRGRQAANKRNNLEGIEESLGPADQVRVPVT